MKLGRYLIIPLLVGAISACSAQPITTIEKPPEQRPANDDEGNKESFVNASALKVRRQRIRVAHIAKEQLLYEKKKPTYTVQSLPKQETFYIDVSSGKVRNGPGITFDNIDTLQKNTPVNAYESVKNGQTTWYHIIYNKSHKAWISGTILTSQKPISKRPSSTEHSTTKDNDDSHSKDNVTNIHLLQAPLIAQMPELPRGCEVTSLAMLLQYAGIKVGKMDLAKKVDKVLFTKNGLHGNPHDGFVGDMYSFKKQGLGVFHEPIARLARKYLGNRVKDFSGSTWKSVENQIDQGKPVWVIVTSRYKWLPDSYWSTWQTVHGPVKITYKEHAVLITGYSNNKVYFNDPLAVIKNRSWSKSDFVAGWRQFGSQAVSYN